jgi:hypothetical protein
MIPRSLLLPGRWGLQYTVQKSPAGPAHLEEKRHGSVDVVVFLGRHQSMPDYPVRVPPRRDPYGRGSDVLDAVPPPGGVEQHVPWLQSSTVHWAELEQGESFAIVLMRPQTHQKACSLSQHCQRIPQKGIIGVNKPGRAFG